MAWVTTDKDAACILTIKKTAGGKYLPGYPKVYNVLDAFDAYLAITVSEWQKMEASPRFARLGSFRSYVEKVEGISIFATQTNEPIRLSATPPGGFVEE